MDALSSIGTQPGYTMPKFHNRSSCLFPSTKNNKIFQETDASRAGVQSTVDNSAPLTCVGKPSKGLSSKTRIQSAQSRIEKTLQKRIDVNHSFLLNNNGRLKKTRPNSSGINRLRAPRPQSAVSVKEKNETKQTNYQKHLISSCSQPKHEKVEHSDITGHKSTSGENVQDKNVKTEKDTERPKHSQQDLGDNKEYTNIEMALVPIGGQPIPVFDVGWEAPVPTYHYQMPKSFKQLSSNNPKPFMPPCPADKMADIFNMNGSAVKKEESEASAKSDIDEGLKPSVYGLDNNRQVYGASQEAEATGYPYKLSSQDDLVNGMRVLTFPKGDIKAKGRALPESLEPLRPWLTENLFKEFIGVDPGSCLVFLPSLQGKDLSEIPEVPTPHDVEEELPYKEKIPNQEVIVPKKYEHPAFNRKPVEDWVCKHNKPNSRIYGEDGQLLHERYQGKRTAGVIRKEIEELENLLKGIGSKHSSCSVVNYQAEIDEYRSLQHQAMAKIPDRLLHSPKPVDTFGLRQFYVEHDEVIQQISKQHALCVEELATLETEIGILSDRKYFKHQVSKQPD